MSNNNPKSSLSGLVFKKTVFIFLTVTVLLSTSCVTRHFYSLAVERNDKSFLFKPPKKDGPEHPAPERHEPSIYTRDASWFSEQPYLTLQMESRDGLKLAGYWLPAKTPDGNISRYTVILVHGYSCNAFSMSSFARYYHEELGFSVLAVDARGHGASEGDYIGFGWPERYDIVDWTNEVIKLAGIDCSVVLHGISMGGATVMMSSGEDLPPQIKSIIEDCGYTGVSEELAYQMMRMYHIDNESLLKRISAYSEKRTGYGFFEASALAQLPKARVPMLFIHGGSDTFVPTEMVYRCFDAHPGPKELLIIPGAGHGLSWTEGTEEYQGKLREFLAARGFTIDNR